MKKIYLISSFVILALSLTGCSSTKEAKDIRIIHEHYHFYYISVNNSNPNFQRRFPGGPNMRREQGRPIMRNSQGNVRRPGEKSFEKKLDQQKKSVENKKPANNLRKPWPPPDWPNL